MDHRVNDAVADLAESLVDSKSACSTCRYFLSIAYRSGVAHRRVQGGTSALGQQLAEWSCLLLNRRATAVLASVCRSLGVGRTGTGATRLRCVMFSVSCSGASRALSPISVSVNVTVGPHCYGLTMICACRECRSPGAAHAGAHGGGRGAPGRRGSPGGSYSSVSRSSASYSSTNSDASRSPKHAAGAAHCCVWSGHLQGLVMHESFRACRDFPLSFSASHRVSIM